MPKKSTHYYTMLLLFTFLSLSRSYSQAALDTITIATCQCIAEKNLDALDSEALNMELGFCIIESLSRHPNAANELNVNIYDTESMGNVGEKIGSRMALLCPSVVAKIAAVNSTPARPSEQQMEGVITGIEGREFGFVLLRDDQGRTHRLLWLRYFPNSERLMEDARRVTGQRVRVTFTPIECYSPAERDYFERREIRAMEFLR